MGHTPIGHLVKVVGPSGPTAFAEASWNAPYYACPGFRALAGADLTDGLREILAEEATPASVVGRACA
ncbi:hypothetical protein ACIO87_08735 [Streptomyces sp. NPDC087218]|uniref:hypothetical protein n=1 Tax=Streptomyces sp. NPDC087218 TaxID=3365769 RepID=UPI0038142A82